LLRAGPKLVLSNYLGLATNRWGNDQLVAIRGFKLSVKNPVAIMVQPPLSVKYQTKLAGGFPVFGMRAQRKNNQL